MPYSSGFEDRRAAGEGEIRLIDDDERSGRMPGPVRDILGAEHCPGRICRVADEEQSRAVTFDFFGDGLRVVPEAVVRGQHRDFSSHHPRDTIVFGERRPEDQHTIARPQERERDEPENFTGAVARQHLPGRTSNVLGDGGPKGCGRAVWVTVWRHGRKSAKDRWGRCEWVCADAEIEHGRGVEAKRAQFRLVQPTMNGERRFGQLGARSHVVHGFLEHKSRRTPVSDNSQTAP